MARVTTAVLSEQIKNLHEDFKDFKDDQFKPLLKECKENTAFRQKSLGVIGAVAFVCTTVGLMAFKFFDWIRGLIGK